MDRKDWEAVIATMRNAPLQNMAHAEAVDKLIIKVGKHAGLHEDAVARQENQDDDDADVGQD